MALTLCHELTHIMWTIRRYGKGLDADDSSHINWNPTEPQFSTNDPATELGRAWEEHVFGGCVVVEKSEAAVISGFDITKPLDWQTWAERESTPLLHGSTPARPLADDTTKPNIQSVLLGRSRSSAGRAAAKQHYPSIDVDSNTTKVLTRPENCNWLVDSNMNLGEYINTFTQQVSLWPAITKQPTSVMSTFTRNRHIPGFDEHICSVSSVPPVTATKTTPQIGTDGSYGYQNLTPIPTAGSSRLVLEASVSTRTCAQRQKAWTVSRRASSRDIYWSDFSEHPARRRTVAASKTWVWEYTVENMNEIP
jgi:hypothetical protein